MDIKCAINVIHSALSEQLGLFLMAHKMSPHVTRYHSTIPFRDKVCILLWSCLATSFLELYESQSVSELGI